MLRLTVSAVMMFSAAAFAAAPSPLFTQRINTFGQRLWAGMHLGEGNQAVSPLSVGVCLSMLIDGANEPTRSQLLKTLGYEGLSPKEIGDESKVLIDGLTHTPEFTMANGLWLKGDLTPKRAYLNSLHQTFGGEVRRFATPSPVVTREINEWVKAHTKDRIPKILDGLDERTRAVLVNALTFDGKWAQPFDTSQTRAEPFTIGSEKVTVQMMHQRGSYILNNYSTFDSVTLPYAGNRFEIQFMLPKPGRTPSQALVDSGQGQTADSRPTISNIAIPKFKIECKYDLKSSLGALGLAPLYEDAKLGKIASDLDRNTQIDQIQHRTYVKVNEEGTEAAAATGTSVRALAISNGGKFILDRPFAFSIVDTKSGAVIMMGTIQNPKN